LKSLHCPWNLSVVTPAVATALAAPAKTGDKTIVAANK
jgi:hypothetical protein